MASINILFIGDIVGKPGFEMVQSWLPTMQQKYKADAIIVNGENTNDGKGILQKEGEVLFNMGVRVITGGNHTWDKPQAQEYLKNEPRVLRPQNYPRGAHGNGHYVFETSKGRVAVLNLQGRTFLPMIDCPFRSAEWILANRIKDTKVVIVDFHAEATAEKQALAYHLDGKVSAILGTHTHVQTADERIFPNGTAFISDVGMTGPYSSVIGMKIAPALNRFLYQTPQKYETAQDDVHMCGVSLKIDTETGKALEIERFTFPEFDRTAGS